jgi:hypothetical protein
MKKLSLSIKTYGIMFTFICSIQLLVLYIANEYQGIWINIAWVSGFSFGIKTILFLDLIKEWKNKEEKKL